MIRERKVFVRCPPQIVNGEALGTENRLGEELPRPGEAAAPSAR